MNNTMIDIVFPNGHEKAFIAMAEQLGISALCFMDSQADLPLLQRQTSVKLYFATSNVHQSKKKADIKIIDGHGRAREMIERNDVDLVFHVEEQHHHDRLHQRQSGLNHVLANLAHEKGKLIGFSLHQLLQLAGGKRSQLLGRMQQNVLLCRKYKVGMALASFARTPYEIRALHEMLAVGALLGMAPGEAKEAVVAVEKNILENKREKEG